ncbi:unnamed protein product [Candidula unifasciata]|uniref:G-protein coupled receptors family 1 profile domain-containing protein n=1 Tax=Candidula unifasciata TaxID=100452 RepID=A0A8S3ZS68_9EUPU|nr:unnamed protein product [Candidula unifasciata]
MTVNLTEMVTMATPEFNTTISTSTDLASSPMTVEVFAVVLMAILIVFTFQGNLWIIITIMATDRLRSSLANILVINVCTIDLLASIVVLPLSALTFLRGLDTLAKQTCTVTGFFNTLVMVSSMLSLCAVSMERFYSISLPMHYAGHATPCIYLMVVIFIWCSSLVLSVLPLTGFGAYSYQPAKRTCTYTSQEHSSPGSTFVILIFVTSFIIPSLIMVVMYVSVFRVARKAAATVRPQSKPDNGIKTECTATRQPIYSISIHSAQRSTKTNPSPRDIQRVFTLNDSEYSKNIYCNENCTYTEGYSSHPAEITNNESSLQLPPQDKYDNKQGQTCQAKIWSHEHVHQGKVRCQFLCVCCRKQRSIISVPHVRSPDSQLIPTVHQTEAVAEIGAKDNSHGVSFAMRKVKASHVKALRTLMIIVVSHLIVWVPYFACQIYELASGQMVPQVTGIIVTWLSFTSYTANPCLYGLMNRTIREELGQLLKTTCVWGCCCSCSNGVVTWRRPCRYPPADEESGSGEGENFYQFLQRTQASDSTPPVNIDAERNR